MRYFSEAEKHFSLRFGRPLLLSPRDVAKVEEWHAMGVPLRAVKRGIDRHFERLDPSRRRKAVVLAFCENAVLDEWENMRAQGSRGAARPRKVKESPKKTLEKFLNRLKRARKKSKADWAAPLFEELRGEAERALASKKIPTAEKFAARLERRVLKFLKARAPKERLDRARRKIAKALAPYRPRMDEAVYREALEHQTLEAVWKEAGIPKIPG
ncbi:MAG: hypothetical protein JSV08_06990 [Acidobacteriota bacterium]|nr:MAG: hypothetical protein JSV08_06990 [Acidobacteriota bacterium]